MPTIGVSSVYAASRQVDGGAVVAETDLQHAEEVRRHRHLPGRAPARGLPGDRRRGHSGFRLLTAQREGEQRVGAGGRDEAGIAGHLRQLVRLRLRCPCRGQPSAGRVDEGAAEGKSVGQPGQRSALPGPVDPVGGQLLHRCVVQQIGGRDRDQFEPSEGGVGVHIIGEECLDRALQRRHGRRVPGGHPRGVALQQQIGGRVRSVSRRGQLTRRLRDFLQKGGAGGPPGEHGGLQRGQQRVPCGGRVEHPQLPCRTDQGGGGIGHLPAVKPDPPPQPVRLRDRQRIAQALMASTSRASARSTVPASRWACAADKCRSARRSLSGVSSAARSSSAAAAAQPPRLASLICGRFQRGGDLFVGPGGGFGQMPGPGNCVDLRIARRCQGPVSLPALDCSRSVVDRRPDKRMEEPHLRPEDHQSSCLRRHGRRFRNAQRGGRPPQAIAPARLVRRRQQQQPLRVRRQPPHTPYEGLFEPLTDGQRLRQGLPAQSVAPRSARGRPR